MTLQWLGQGQILGLASGHTYRARWLVPGQGGDFPCPITDTKLNQIKSTLETLGSVVSPNYSTSNWEPWAILKLPNPQVFNTLVPGPWPADRREVPGNLNPGNLCPVWGQSTTTSDFNVPLDMITAALQPLGGVLMNFWDETSGQRLYDAPASFVPSPPGQTPPFVPPLPPIQPSFPPTQTPTVPLPPPPTPRTEKKKVSPLVWVLGGAVLIGSVWLVTS